MFEEVFDNCCKGSPSSFSMVVMVCGKYLSCIKLRIWGSSKILALTFSVSVQGTFHTNMQSSHFPYLKTVSSASG